VTELIQLSKVLVGSTSFFIFNSSFLIIKKNVVLLTGGNKQNDKSFYKRKILESEKIFKDYFSS
jgi:hypothetical protein